MAYCKLSCGSIVKEILWGSFDIGSADCRPCGLQALRLWGSFEIGPADLGSLQHGCYFKVAKTHRMS